MTKMTTVTITECKGAASKSWTSTHRTADKNEAIERAVAKHFGAKAFLQPDSGLHGYGQIFRTLPNTGSGFSATSLTGRVQIDA